MRSAMPLLLAAAMITPAVAQPIEITVRGGRTVAPELVDPGRLPDEYNLYRDRWNWNFDPGAAAFASAMYSFHRGTGRSPLNMERAATLNRTGDSLAEHQLRCQAIHPTYELVSDTYIGADGIPVPCR